LNISRPEFLTVEVEAFQNSGSGHDINTTTISHRRRRRHVLLPHFYIAGAEWSGPNRLALVSIDAPQEEIVTVSHTEEEPLQPGCGSFQMTFSSVVHFAGKFLSPLTPFMLGPRQCGQLSARAEQTDSATIRNKPVVLSRIWSPS
jgi:hypothetical protein